MHVWLKDKMRRIAEKRQSSKDDPHSVRGLNKLGRMMSEIKAKRESLVAKAGFSATIADFVANSHLSWIPANLHMSARLGEKKKFWKPRKRSSQKAHLAPPASATPNSTDPPLKICHDQHHVGQAINTEEINVADIGVVHKQQAAPGSDVMYSRVFMAIVVTILSLSPILEAKKAALGVTMLAFFYFRVVITGRMSSYSANSCLNLIRFLNYVTTTSVLFFIHTDKPLKFPESPPPNPKSGLSENKRCPSDRGLGKQQQLSSAFPTSCENSVAKSVHPGFHPTPTKYAESIGNSSARGIKKPRSKFLRKLVFRRCSGAPDSPKTKNGTDLRTTAFGHSGRASPAASPTPSELAEMDKGKMSCHSDLGIQTEVRGGSISQALKFQYSNSNPGCVNTEKLKTNTRERKYGSFSCLFLLIAVLIGLVAGRLPALVCALCSCLLMKAVEIEKKNMTGSPLQSQKTQELQNSS